MSQTSGFDMSKLSTGEKVVAGAAAVYFIWAFLPFWYSVDLVVASDSISGFRGVTLIAWLLAVVALVEIGVRRFANADMNLPVKTGVLHLAVAGLALLFTLLGLATAPTLYGVSWGLFVAIVIALVWAYGAYMMYSQPAEMGASGGDSVPPPPPGGFGG